MQIRQGTAAGRKGAARSLVYRLHSKSSDNSAGGCCCTKQVVIRAQALQTQPPPLQSMENVAGALATTAASNKDDLEMSKVQEMAIALRPRQQRPLGRGEGWLEAPAGSWHAGLAANSPSRPA
jgi:hypothetical protein